MRRKYVFGNSEIIEENAMNFNLELAKRNIESMTQASNFFCHEEMLEFYEIAMQCNIIEIIEHLTVFFEKVTDNDSEIEKHKTNLCKNAIVSAARYGVMDILKYFVNKLFKSTSLDKATVTNHILRAQHIRNDGHYRFAYLEISKMIFNYLF